MFPVVVVVVVAVVAVVVIIAPSLITLNTFSDLGGIVKTAN